MTTLRDIAIEARDILLDILSALRGEVTEEGLPENAPSWNNEHLTVATPGTAVQIPHFRIYPECKIVVRAMADNDHNVFIGNSKSSAVDPNRRITLQANESTDLKIRNGNLIWLDAVDAGEGIEYWSETR